MNIARIVTSLPKFMRRHKLARAMLYLSPASGIQEIRFNGSARLFADIRDPFARSYLFAEGFDPEFFSIAAPFLSGGGVFFDVGANFGFCTFGLIDCLGSLDVQYHLFEANRDICSLLSRSAALHKGRDIRINHSCVTDAPGVSKLRIVPDNFGSSFIAEDGIQSVENIILDDYIAEHGIAKINFLKIDIEGWEARAFSGAAKSLSAGVADAVYFEASSDNLARAGFSLGDCFALLRDAGFSLFYVRSADFKSQVADEAKAFNLDIQGHKLRVASMEDIPSRLHTDILAIHLSSGILR